MQVTLGDLADKLSIAIRKRRIHPNSVTDDELMDIVQSIFVTWRTELDNKTETFFIEDLVKLCDINYQIWHLEAEIRADRDELSDEFIGKRAKAIRELNKQRVGIRDRINSYSGGYKIVNV